MESSLRAAILRQAIHVDWRDKRFINVHRFLWCAVPLKFHACAINTLLRRFVRSPACGYNPTDSGAIDHDVQERLLVHDARSRYAHVPT